MKTNNIFITLLDFLERLKPYSFFLYSFPWFLLETHIHRYMCMYACMKKVKVLVAQSCLTLCDPVDCSLPCSSVHRIFQARILECEVILFSRESYPWIKLRSPEFHANPLYIYICIYVYIHIYIHTYICVCVYVYICMYTHTHVYIHTHTHTHNHISVCFSVCIYIVRKK